MGRRETAQLEVDEVPSMEVKRLAIVVMGVSGTGKSSVGSLLAARLGCSLLEGDAFHPAANIDKMSRGIPLDDDDRWPWLDRIGAALGDAVTVDGIGIATCSALTRSYRDRLRAAAGRQIAFVHLTASRATLDQRMRSRPGHFMPASLLDSQLALLEPPSDDELARDFTDEQPLESLVGDVLTWLNGIGAGGWVRTNFTRPRRPSGPRPQR